MNNNTLKTALVLLVCLGVPAVYLAWRDGSRWFADAEDTANELALPALAASADDLTRIVLRQADESLTLERAPGSSWTLPAKGGFPAQEDKVVELIRGLATLELIEQKTARAERHEKIGLVAPQDGGEVAREVQLYAGAEAPVAQLLLGDRFYESTVPALFVRQPDENQTWLAQGELTAAPGARDWMEREVLALDREAIREARWTEVLPADGAEPESYVTRREDSAAYDFELAEVPEGREPAAAYVVSALARVPQALRFEDVARAGSVELDSARRHVRAEFETFDGLLVRLDAHELEGSTEAGADASPKTWVQVSFDLTPGAGEPPIGPVLPEPAEDAAGAADEGSAAEASVELEGIPGAQAAPDPGPTREELEARVAQLRGRTADWIYAVEAGTATSLLRGPAEMTVEPAADDTGDAPGAPAEPGVGALEDLDQEALQALIEAASQQQDG